MKAIALISGGLDSTLAARLIKELGIEILGLNFKTPFCLCDGRKSGCGGFAQRVATSLGIELKVMNITEDFLKVLESPKHGYGSNMNPCIDCRILKFRKAKELMQRTGAAFIITGEVLGQRPMSQHRQALKIIEREAGLEGLVLRPLCAKLLEETIPEKELWVSKEKLLGFHGRTRKPQIELAKKLGVQDYPCPAGGCLLTDLGFSQRLKDLMRQEKLGLNNIELLKVGRHFRVSGQTKLVVGRDEGENQRLFNLAQDSDYLFRPLNIAGPVAIGRGEFGNDLIKICCSIVCRYSDLNSNPSACILYKRIPDAEERALEVSPINENKLIDFRI